jgi:NADH-quinone oxidoreductase subunit G
MPKIIIDNQEYAAGDKRNCLEAALENGVDLPYFCYHPALGSVGACRLCAVRAYKDDEDKTGRIVMSCMQPATEGTRISVEDAEATQFRQWVLEWLMINHPHDCPICDEGGECHLQDMTVMTGHNKRRYRGSKRTYKNQDLGPLIHHEMNRCIQCYRCVRFYDDYAGGHDLGVFSQRNRVYFGRFEEGTLENPFAGNLIDICPTGVFTDKTFKQHYTRKWDQQTTPSICIQCGMGCNTLPAARYGTLRRILPRYNEEVNGYFICDRGRFGYDYNNEEGRLRTAFKRIGDKRESVSADEAWKDVQDFVSKDVHVAGIGSPRASLESNYALRSLVGTKHFSNGLSAHNARLTQTGVSLYKDSRCVTPTRIDIENADTIVILGGDLTHEIPLVDLSIRQAVRNGAHLFIASCRPTSLDEVATEVLIGHPSTLIKRCEDIAANKSWGSKLHDAERPLIIAGWHHGERKLLALCGQIAQSLHAQKETTRFLISFPEANQVGVGLLGGSSVEEIIDRIEGGEIKRLIVLENDLFERVLDPSRLEKAIAALDHLLVLDHSSTQTSVRADTVIPVATASESNGTWINAEGRAARAYQVYQSDPWVPESWTVLADLPDRKGRLRVDEWTRSDDIIATLAAQEAFFAPIKDIAPPVDFRINGQKIPRLSHRFSGRTALPTIKNIREEFPKPPEDNESPFSFSMEGNSSQTPSGLLPRFWAPQWNSAEAINKFQIELGKGLHGGSTGKRLFVGADPSGDPSKNEPISLPQQDFADQKNLLIIPVFEIFGSDSLSRKSAAIEELIPEATVSVHPETAQSLDWIDQDMAHFSLQGCEFHLRVRYDERLAKQVALVPAHFEQTQYIQGPTYLKGDKK